MIGGAFTIPNGMDWNQPRALGEAFAGHLRRSKLRLRRVERFYIPAGWYILRTTRFPPVDDPELLAEMIHTAGEEMFAQRSEDFALCWQTHETPEACHVSVLACHRPRVEAISQFCQGANLRPDALCPLAPCLAQSLQNDRGEILVLDMGDELTLAHFQHGRVTWCRTLHHAGQADLKTRLQSAMLTWPSDPPACIRAWCDDSTAQTLSRLTGLPVEPAVISQSDSDSRTALVRQVSNTSIRTLNLLADTERATGRDVRPLVRKGLIVAALLCVLLGWPAYHWLDLRQRLAQTRSTLQALEARTSQVRRTRDLLAATQPWRSDQPHMLNALRAVTEHFPQEGSIWVSDMTFSAKGVMTLSGKARSQREVLELISRLRADRRFENVVPGSVGRHDDQRYVPYDFQCVFKEPGA
jgi:hypothetical protein